MMKKTPLSCMMAVLCFWTFVLQSHASDIVKMHDGWHLQSACKATDSGEAISKSDFKSDSWLGVAVPTTVLAAQVPAGEFKDPYFGTNLQSIPGMSYPVGKNFSNLPMPDDSPYNCGWWFRRQFTLPVTQRGKSVVLEFDGINYEGEVWVNGTRIADRQQVVGAYRRYAFEISKLVKWGAPNTVAIETFAPPVQALAINWVDWNPMPPDKDMGLWGEVRLITRGPVAIQRPSVFTHFPDASLKTALLTVTADLENTSDKSVQGTLFGTVAGVPISVKLALDPGEKKTITVSPDQFPKLAIQGPRVWWPAEYGAQPLEKLTLKFASGAAISDEQTISFGIREVTSELTPQGYRLFSINHQPILIRGGGWSQDMLLRESHDRLVHQFALVRDLHLNTIRLEGKLESEDFFDLADRQGILVMAGWCCCDYWEHWKDWKPGDLDIAAASLQSQILRLRSHPSLLVWLDGSDNPPPPDVENRYLQVLKEAQWPNPVLSSASATPTTVTGPSGVKMSGPYDFVAPSYWYQDKDKRGGAFGFNTETSPGPAVPSIAELRRFLPESALWPPDNPTWNYHAGGGKFKDLSNFNSTMTSTYGPTDDIESYVKVAEMMQYDGERAMFEAYSGQRYTSTGVVQWMLNNAWPSLIWHLYDYYLVPGAGYYGAKKANQPVHLQYNYDDHSVYLVNSTLTNSGVVAVTIEVFDPALHLKFSKTLQTTAQPNSSRQLLTIPDDALNDESQLHFLRLSMRNPGSPNSSVNFYWTPSRLTDFDWAKSDYNFTPASTHEVMTDLRSLPEAVVHSSLIRKQDNLSLTLENASKTLAFGVHAQVLDHAGHEVPMILWDDNFIELMPGERRVITASLTSEPTSPLAIKILGWNVSAVQHAIPRVEAHK